MALADATKEMLFLQTLCKTLSIHQEDHNTIFTDNLGAIALSKGQARSHQRSKHIDIKFHFVREQTTIKYNHISGKENPADVMTKGLPRAIHLAALNMLTIHPHD